MLDLTKILLSIVEYNYGQLFKCMTYVQRLFSCIDLHVGFKTYAWIPPMLYHGYLSIPDVMKIWDKININNNIINFKILLFYQVLTQNIFLSSESNMHRHFKGDFCISDFLHIFTSLLLCNAKLITFDDISGTLHFTLQEQHLLRLVFKKYYNGSLWGKNYSHILNRNLTELEDKKFS